MDYKIKNYPEHFAIIPDGCRRWALKNGFKVWNGHKKGIELFEDIGLWSIVEFPIKYYTIYGLSLENIKKRSGLFLKVLHDMYAEYFIRLSQNKVIHENKVNLSAIGRLELLPENVQEAIKTAQDATASYKNKFIRIALAYSGREEIIDSVNQILASNKKLTEKSISENLYTDVPEPDLIMRTSEKRMSNFLLWQGAYSELYFIDKLWPDMTKEDYINVLKDFDSKKRRYGSYPTTSDASE